MIRVHGEASAEAALRVSHLGASREWACSYRLEGRRRLRARLGGGFLY